MKLVEVLHYVHRNRRLIWDGSPGRPPRLSHNSWALKQLKYMSYQNQINQEKKKQHLYANVDLKQNISFVFSLSSCDNFDFSYLVAVLTLPLVNTSRAIGDTGLWVIRGFPITLKIEQSSTFTSGIILRRRKICIAKLISLLIDLCKLFLAWRKCKAVQS